MKVETVEVRQSLENKEQRRYPVHNNKVFQMCGITSLLKKEKNVVLLAVAEVSRSRLLTTVTVESPSR